LFRKFSCFNVILVNLMPYWESLHTYTHCMNWVIYLKFLSAGNFWVDWTLNSLLYLYIFLRGYLIAISVVYTFVFWSWFKGKYIFFSTNFPLVSVFQCEVSGRVRLRRPDGQVTRLDTRSLVACLCGNVRLDGLVMRPDGDPQG
jgi:hypothetical protein